MIRIIIFLLTFVFSFFFSNLKAQNSTTVPCNSKEYHQFDFWVGTWNVFDVNNKLIGQNTIIQMPNACAIQENWTSANGNSLGTSYSYFDISDQKWHQLWIDNKGYVLKTEGHFKNDKMILNSEIVESKKGKFYNRITWIQNEDQTVTQIWEYVSPDHKVIKEAFKGIYKKKKS
ncbi:hypothetical protein [Tenacibaculum agarivorans]|uniref:hypothetical protein n=1 Tax=Tenacibaculum agarivorans TaxID=1908389 RepID=UPI00094BB8A7|nr:hypothetical protein [Tenacibaculum agarivorans]